MYNAQEFKALRSGFISSAQQNVKKYVSENRAVLPQLLEITIEKIEAMDIEGVKFTSYQLFTAAKVFERQDITNIAELLYKMMNHSTYSTEKKVFDVFKTSLITLANSSGVDKNLEKLITQKIYDVLRNIPKAKTL